MDYLEIETTEVTPSQLKALRIRLGIDMAELAGLLGLGGGRDIVENLEKPRTWTMYQGHIDTLEALETHFYEALEETVSARPSVLIMFPNQSVFETMEPAWAGRLRLNSVHRAVQIRAHEELQDQLDEVDIMELIPAKYDQWLDGRADTPDYRISWAREHIYGGPGQPPVYRIRPGYPVRGQRES